PEADTTGWLPMVAGAWSYQLPVEPDSPYPVPVWYRVPFTSETAHDYLDLIVDGFSGTAWRLWVNGSPVTTPPRRSDFDAQMQAIDIAPYVRHGDNVIALRLCVNTATDGLLDNVKLMGDFALRPASTDGYTMVAPRRTVEPCDWTQQGYPYFSGRASYRHAF